MADNEDKKSDVKDVKGAASLDSTISSSSEKSVSKAKKKVDAEKFGKKIVNTSSETVKKVEASKMKTKSKVKKTSKKVPATMPPPGGSSTSPTSPPPKKDKKKEEKKASPVAKSSKNSKPVSAAKSKSSSSVRKKGQKSGLASKVLPKGPEGVSTRRRARKVRRVIRHIDPWSVLTFSVIFYIVLFGALFVASLIMFVLANWFNVIDSFESFMRESGDYQVYEVKLLTVAKSMAIVSATMVLISSIVTVLLTVVFNLISDLVGGIRVTVVEEDIVSSTEDKNT